MRRVLGARTVVEAIVLIAVPIVALAAGLGWVGIVAASAVAYLLVLAVEGVLARGSAGGAVRDPSRRRRRLEAEPAAAPHRVEALEADAEPEHESSEPEPMPPAAEQDPVPAPPAPSEPAAEPVPVAEQLPAAEPPPAAAPPLAPVPAPPPEPEPVAVPEGAEVVSIGVGAQPREWNVWELDRITRELSGADPALDEERGFLLVYLREFADPGGQLPVDFDGLVRESFGDLLGAL